MNAFVREFFANEFPGWKPRLSWTENSKDIWNSEFPYIPVRAGLELGNTHRWLLDNCESLLQEMRGEHMRRLRSQREGTDWCFVPHNQGWRQMCVVGDAYTVRQEIQNPDVDHDPLLRQHRQNWIQNPGAVPELQQQLEQLGCGFSRLMVDTLEPDGWIHPHRDQGTNSPLGYAWIPLHDFPPCLKIWPVGMVQHQVGDIYLLANTRFAHSVINSQDLRRHVAVVRLDLKKTSEDFHRLVMRSAQDHWY